MLQKDILTGNRLPVLQKRIWKLMPGIILRDPYYMCEYSQLSLLRAKYIGGITVEPAPGSIGPRYFSGCVIKVRKLGWGKGEICFNFPGPDYLAFDGNLEILHDLQTHGIYCTNNKVNHIISKEYLTIDRSLQRNGICSFKYEPDGPNGNYIHKSCEIYRSVMSSFVDFLVYLSDWDKRRKNKIT